MQYAGQNHLTFPILMDSSVWIGAINLGWSIVYIKGPQFKISKLKCFIVPEDCYNPLYSGNP